MSNHKTAPPVPITGLDLDQNAGVPLYRQLYEGLRRAILVGELSPGVKLPSTRALAADLSIGRNTVVNAYEQLLAEGYLEGRTGSGTYIAAELPDHLLRVRSDQKKSAKSRTALRGLSNRGQLLAGTTVSEPHDFAIPRAFRPGLPAMEIFPFKTWSRLWNRR
ncbi:MAG: GntR family transcriptional regulator, partial [Chloroflexi bacterium]|nr:GntR family transcriptional regulator [Chloroflexota bacterium]